MTDVVELSVNSDIAGAIVAISNERREMRCLKIERSE